MSKTPLALFTYNRPSHTELALKAISRCDRIDECDVHIFCDGPKDESQKKNVEALCIVVKKWAKILNAEVVESKENLGLARSIVRGVTTLCKKYGRVIVLEDDFVVSPDFVDYMLQALDRYQEDTNVYQVSGYMFDVEHPSKPDAFFMPQATTRGWATWERAWRVFDWNATGAIEMLADKGTRYRFNLDGSYPYYEMLKGRLNGNNHSWGILWCWAVFKAGGLVLHPRKSLVWIGGFDGTGTHCGNSEIDQAPFETFAKRVFSSTISFPSEVVSDKDAFDKIKNYLRKQKKNDFRKFFAFMFRLLKK